MMDIIGAKVGKVWGNTMPIFLGNNVEINRIRAKAGWQCSVHHHRSKHNLFYVISGQLIIHTHKDGLDDKTLLGPGEYTAIKPGDSHSFEVIEDVDALEIYWVKLDINDIVRETQGGPVREKTMKKRPKSSPVEPNNAFVVARRQERKEKKAVVYLKRELKAHFKDHSKRLGQNIGQPGRPVLTALLNSLITNAPGIISAIGGILK